MIDGDEQKVRDMAATKGVDVNMHDNVWNHKPALFYALNDDINDDIAASLIKNGASLRSNKIRNIKVLEEYLKDKIIPTKTKRKIMFKTAKQIIKKGIFKKFSPSAKKAAIITVLSKCTTKICSPKVAALVKSMLKGKNIEDGTVHAVFNIAIKTGQGFNILFKNKAYEKRTKPTYRIRVHAPHESWTPLMAAIAGGKTGYFTRLLKVGQDINETDINKWTPLMLSIDKWKTNFFEKLIEHGADINIRNDKGNSALIIASNKGDVSSLEKLIEHGADINIRNKEGNSALIIASNKGDVSSLETLIEHGADININIRNNEGKTGYMHCKIKKDFASAVKKMGIWRRHLDLTTRDAINKDIKTFGECIEIFKQKGRNLEYTNNDDNAVRNDVQYLIDEFKRKVKSQLNKINLKEVALHAYMVNAW